MPELRWILILLGGVALAGIYLLGRRQEDPWWNRQRERLRKHFARKAPKRHEPNLHARPGPVEDDAPETVKDLRTLERLVDEKKRPDYLAAGGSPDRIITLHLRAHRGIVFRGTAIAAAAGEVGLRHGAMNIFHYHEGGDPDAPVLFSMANMFKPGEFDPAALEAIETQGLTFFLALPSPRGAIQALEPMVAAARGMSERLHGEVLDESRSTLSRQRLETLREELGEYERRRLLRGQR